MQLIDNNIEYAFSGEQYTNIGEEDNVLYEFSNLSIFLKDISNSIDDVGAKGIVLRLNVSNRRSSELWLCYSMLRNDDKGFFDDYVLIEANQEQEIKIIIEDYDIAYTDNRKVQMHFVLEDGRRRILGRCNSISAEYNIFSGRYRYKKHNTFSKGKRRDYRELDIKVNKLSQRQFFAMDWSYMYIHKTIPLVVTNCTDRSRAFEIRSLEFDGKTPDDEDLIGINSLEDVISIEPWASFEINMILPFDDYIPDGTMLIFDFIDIATNSRYLNVYTYDSEIQKCKIDYSFVFLHEDFECE